MPGHELLYLSAQALCVPKDKVLIIDEPEVHRHCSILNRLWKKLELCRPDCLFICITHDLQFATAHGDVDKIWIKVFDGAHWAFKKVVSEELPEELTFEILGRRKNVLFVEGERSGLASEATTEHIGAVGSLSTTACEARVIAEELRNNNDLLVAYMGCSKLGMSSLSAVCFAANM